MARKMLRNVEKRGVQAARNGPSPPPTPAGGPVAKPELEHGGSPWFKGTRRQGPPTLRHQCQFVQDPLSLELNRRLVVKSRLSEIFSAVNASVGPPHFFVISCNLTMINIRTIGSVLTLHRHFHLSPRSTGSEARRERGRPPCGFWDGSASAHRTHARIAASTWDTFDQTTAGPSVPLLS